MMRRDDDLYLPHAAPADCVPLALHARQHCTFVSATAVCGVFCIVRCLRWVGTASAAEVVSLFWGSVALCSVSWV
jgi:hypothetical protein